MRAFLRKDAARGAHSLALAHLRAEKKKEAEVNSASFHYFIFFHRLRAVKLCETGSFALRAKIARGLVQGSFAHMAGKIRFREC